MNSINLDQKFQLIDEYWSPKIISQSNGQLIKIAKVKGEFVWHHHEDEDEMFFIIKGRLFIDTRDEIIELNEGEMAVIPKGVEHCPRTGEEEAWIMLIEPDSTKHTGDVISDLTKNKKEFL